MIVEGTRCGVSAVSQDTGANDVFGCRLGTAARYPGGMKAWRVIRHSRRWRPGSYNGRFEEDRHVQPFVFRLE